MPEIPIHYLGDRPYVMASLCLRGTVLDPPLEFLIDTAAQNTMIAPRHERDLLQVNHAVGVFNFRHGAKSVVTLLGRAPVKFLRERDMSLVFVDIHKTQVRRPLEYVFFADGQRRVVPPFARWLCKWISPSIDDIWNMAGEQLKHSILGRDILHDLALVSVPLNEYGFLVPPNTSIYDCIHAASGPFADFARYFKEGLGPDEIQWID